MPTVQVTSKYLVWRWLEADEYQQQAASQQEQRHHCMGS